MIKRKHRRKNQKRNKYSIWWWLCAALAVLVVILIIDIKPWRKHRIVVSDQWPYNDKPRESTQKTLMALIFHAIKAGFIGMNW